MGTMGGSKGVHESLNKRIASIYWEALTNNSKGRADDTIFCSGAQEDQISDHHTREGTHLISGEVTLPTNQSTLSISDHT